MLEFLLFAFFSSSTQDFLNNNQPVPALPGIEIFSSTELPQKKAPAIAPKLSELSDTAILSMDLDSGKILFSKNPERVQNIASLTKLMTVLIILENHKMEEVVTVPFVATEVEGTKIDLYEYEQLTVKTLLEAILISSANDAATALAIHHAETEEAFVKKMNNRARELELSSAKFFNSTGLDISISEDIENMKGNKMTARDVLKLSRIMLENSFVRNTVKKSHFYGTSIDERFFHEKESTNQLLGTFLNVSGLKTGFTHLAGECLVSLGTTKKGHEILTIALGSSDRFGETKSILSWIYDNFEWK